MGFFAGFASPSEAAVGNVGLYAILADHKASGAQSGTFTAGDWRTRDLTTKVVDEIGIDLTSNQFTLPAGKYRVKAVAPAITVRQHAIRIYNVTDDETPISGMGDLPNEILNTLRTSGLSMAWGEIDIPSPKVFELQHQCRDTDADDGFGVRVGTVFTVATEVYAMVELLKVS